MVRRPIDLHLRILDVMMGGMSRSLSHICWLIPLTQPEAKQLYAMHAIGGQWKQRNLHAADVVSQIIQMRLAHGSRGLVMFTLMPSVDIWQRNPVTVQQWQQATLSPSEQMSRTPRWLAMSVRKNIEQYGKIVIHSLYSF